MRCPASWMTVGIILASWITTGVSRSKTGFDNTALWATILMRILLHRLHQASEILTEMMKNHGVVTTRINPFAYHLITSHFFCIWVQTLFAMAYVILISILNACTFVYLFYPNLSLFVSELMWLPYFILCECSQLCCFSPFYSVTLILQIPTT